MSRSIFVSFLAVLWASLCALPNASWGAEPPALNPFKVGGGSAPGTQDREDAIPGYIEMSNGSIHYGRIFLTRDKRLQVNDEEMQREREIPLQPVEKIESKVIWESMEKEWRFKELASDEKLYTGRSYPARKCSYTVTLKSGKTISGALSGIVFLIPGDYGPGKGGETPKAREPERYLIHKRDKGEIGQTLATLLYVKTIKLGEEAFEEGRRRAGGRSAPPPKAMPQPAK